MRPTPPSASRRRRARRRRWLLAAGALLVALAAWRWWPGGPRSGATAPAAVALADLAVPLRRAAAARQALDRRPVVFTWEGQDWSFTLAELGVALAPDGGVEVDRDRLAAALAPVAPAVALAAAPARLLIRDGAPHVEPDRPGRRLDPALGARLLQAALANPPAQQPWDPAAGPPPALRLPLPVLAVSAVPTERQLLALGIKRRIATFSTHYDPVIPRGENVERAARALDGLVLAPGELFSYNAAVGPVSADTGWKEAYVILGGELVPGVGGGVCQTATTVYGAALRAGLQVVERHPHQLAVAYTEPSQDAAVSPGLEDLKLRNGLPTGVLFEVAAGGGTVSVTLWGDAPPGRVVLVESAVVGDIDPPLRVVNDPGLPPGTEVEQLPGHAGFRSQAWRSVWQDGQQASRDLLSTDVYAPTPRVVRRGPRNAMERNTGT